jgi:16S rRNA processing protein RimM
VDDLILIAEVRNVHGSSGFVVIDSYSDFSKRFYELSSVFIEIFGSMKEFFVESVSEVGGKFTIKLKGFNSSDESKIFIGKKIFVDKEHVVKLSENTYFIHDLIGSEVFIDIKRVGIIIDVMILPANDIYVVEDDMKKRLLIPAIKDYIKNFDANLKRLELVPDCDLLYDDED